MHCIYCISLCSLKLTSVNVFADLLLLFYEGRDTWKDEKEGWEKGNWRETERETCHPKSPIMWTAPDGWEIDADKSRNWTEGSERGDSLLWKSLSLKGFRRPALNRRKRERRRLRRERRRRRSRASCCGPLRGCSHRTKWRREGTRGRWRIGVKDKKSSIISLH